MIICQRERETKSNHVVVNFLLYIKMSIKGTFDVTLKKTSVTKLLWPDCKGPRFENLYETLYLVRLMDLKRSSFDEVS